MEFMKSLAIEVPKSHVERLKAINRFDYSKVAHKVQDFLFPGVTARYVDEGIENLKRYYAVALLDAKNPHAVSVPVDVFWHTHIIFSKDYFRFCDEVFGAYVHHVPLDRTNKLQVAQVKKIYIYTIKMHHKLFKEVDESWWPTGADPTVMICYQPVPEYKALGLYKEQKALVDASVRGQM